MEENNQEQINVNQNLNEQPRFTPLGQVNEPMPKKKKSKLGVVIVLLVLLAGIIGGLAYYYSQVYTNPKVVYQQMIKSGVNTLLITEELPSEISTMKAKMKADVDIKLADDYLEDGMEEILDIVNEIDAAMELQMDINEEKMFLGVDSNYEGEKLLKVDALVDAKKEETHFKFEPVFEDVIKLPIESADYEELQDSFKEMKKTLEEALKEVDTVFTDKAARKKATKILSEELVKIVKDEYVSKKNEKITINGKETKASKYVFKMTYEQMVNEYITIFNNLKNNEEFWNCYKNKDELKKTFETLIKELEAVDPEEVDRTIAVNLYRTGLKQDFARVDFIAESQGEEIAIGIEKQEDAFAYKATISGENIFSGTAKLEKIDEETTKLLLTLKVEEIVDLALNMEIAGSINGKFEAFDTKNAKNIEDFSEDEQKQILEKLEDSKLYELVEEISEITGTDVMGDSLGKLDSSTDGLIQTPNENDEKQQTQTDNNVTQIPNGENSNVKGLVTKNGNLIVFTKNNKNVPVDMDFEVEFYDENGIIVGSDTDELVAVGAGREVAVEMTNIPKNFKTYKIYVDEEKSEKTEYFNKIEATHNNNGENIVVQVKNNSKDAIDNITVVVVYYNKGEIVGSDEEMVFDVAAGRAGNFTLYYPYDAEYNDIKFDDYKVIVTEAFSYNW